jgi:hypothetical protein
MTDNLNDDVKVPITDCANYSGDLDGDDELDEQFNEKVDNTDDDKIKQIDIPPPLSNEELTKLNELVKTKSNKELVDYITQLVLLNSKKNSDIEKLQIQNNVAKMYTGNSKRCLIEIISKFVNQKNKHIIFTDSTELKTMTEKQKLSHDELKEKLRNKLKSKQNMTKMYEELQEQLKGSELGDLINSENTEGKKKKKLDPKKLQTKLVNQMANLLKNNPNSFGGSV